MNLNAVVWAVRSSIYYWRTSLAVIAAVAVAVAVLVGALLVGSSMRGSLRQLTLERLGKIDEVVMSRGFFAESLAGQLERNSEQIGRKLTAEPLIFFPQASIDRAGSNGTFRAGGVTLLGIRESFWNLDTVHRSVKSPGPNEIVINRTLADDLGLTYPDVSNGSALITLRFPKPSLLPADSSLGKKRDLTESLVRLRVVQIVEDEGLGKFGLEPSQGLPRNAFVSIRELQNALAATALKSKPDSRQANAILLAGEGRGGHSPEPNSIADFSPIWRPYLEDLGLKLKWVAQYSPRDDSTIFEYFSLTTEQLVFDDKLAGALQELIPDSQPVLTYLINDLRQVGRGDDETAIPYSMFAGVEFGTGLRLTSAVSGQPIAPLKDNEVVLSEWAVGDLGVQPGSALSIKFFEPESTHGQQREQIAELRLADIAKLTRPAKPFQFRRGSPLIPAEYSDDPTSANDPDLTPEVAGLTDSDSIENWDLPFQTREKIRPADDEYWEYYRTTPKGFVNLATAQRLWGSRFGKQTGLRIPATLSESEIRQRIHKLWSSHPELFGWNLIPVKQIGLTAATGSTPFDGLFLGLSLFVIASALILVALLFRLGLEQRAGQMGLFAGLGFRPRRTVMFWLAEASLLGACGAVCGAVAGVGYAKLVIGTLQTFWVGAIARPFLNLHVDPFAVAGGALMGLEVCILTISISVWRAQKTPVRQLLLGQLTTSLATVPARNRYWLVGVLLLAAVALSFGASKLGGEAQAGSFMGSGFLVLVSLLWGLRIWLSQTSSSSKITLNPIRLAILNARRNPRRTLLAVGLISVAAFLIVAISAFRLQPAEHSTGGIGWVAESTQPILDDLNSAKGQTELLGQPLRENWKSYSLRVKPGQDASCNNLYQATQPRVLGIPDSWVERFDDPNQVAMSWAGSTAQSEQEKRNPWHLLNSSHATHSEGIPSNEIPCVIDKNTAMYSLKIFNVGGIYRVRYDSGEELTFRVVGFLDNSLLQGSLLISERDFEKAFPYLSGYRMFLIESKEATVRSVAEGLNAEGFDIRSSAKMMGQFMAVQNTYLSAFQALGGLGLLLGTIGLAAVQMRSIFERRRELAVMQALGFRLSALARLLFCEQFAVLLAGLSIGILAAACTTIPHWLTGSANVPWLSLVILFSAVIAIGLLSGLMAARSIMKLPLVGSLRSE